MENIMSLSSMSEDIYRDQNSSDFFFSDPETDLQVGIYITNCINIVFRGSDSDTDLKYDFDTKTVKLEDGSKVHRGFYTQLFNSTVIKDLQNTLNSLLKEDSELSIYVAGHSLGGALASLFGYTLAKTINKKIKILTIGSPRVGNLTWRNNFNKLKNLTCIRIIGSCDPIPLFPKFNYWHVGKVIVINQNSLYYNIRYHKIRKYNEVLTKKCFYNC